MTTRATNRARLQDVYPEMLCRVYSRMLGHVETEPPEGSIHRLPG
jgi:hypothetical protein